MIEKVKCSKSSDKSFSVNELNNSSPRKLFKNENNYHNYNFSSNNLKRNNININILFIQNNLQNVKYENFREKN